MNLKDRLVADMKEAMKAREEGKLRLSVIRMARAAIKNAEIDKQKELSDAEVLDVLVREVKMRRDAIEEYARADRPETVAQLNEEINILMGYLPEQLSEEAVRQLVQEAVQATGAQGAKEMGKVMGYLMPKVKGRADGKLVNQLVKEALE
ncbi:MAG TPA: GatB/YqeY domain-containing protein [Bacillota bacterium]|nr:GatB/YqeY domain-containing protein [Bacillota bacterium]